MQKKIIFLTLFMLIITSCKKTEDEKIEDDKIENKKIRKDQSEDVNTTSKNWTKTQISKANTAKKSEFLSKVEKETILYINLCRLYPQDFLSKELVKYSAKDSNYKRSLIKYLKNMKPLNALFPDRDAYNYAQCFANEQGKTGGIGHTRISCPKERYWECCSYGMYTGKDIVMQFLIDEGVSSLGHRKNCLNKGLTRIGVSHEDHKRYKKMTVVDMK